MSWIDDSHKKAAEKRLEEEAKKREDEAKLAQQEENERKGKEQITKLLEQYSFVLFDKLLVDLKNAHYQVSEYTDHLPISDENVQRYLASKHGESTYDYTIASVAFGKRIQVKLDKGASVFRAELFALKNYTSVDMYFYNYENPPNILGRSASNKTEIFQFSSVDASTKQQETVKFLIQANLERVLMLYPPPLPPKKESLKVPLKKPFWKFW